MPWDQLPAVPLLPDPLVVELVVPPDEELLGVDEELLESDDELDEDEDDEDDEPLLRSERSASAVEPKLPAERLSVL